MKNNRFVTTQQLTINTEDDTITKCKSQIYNCQKHIMLHYALTKTKHIIRNNMW